MWKVSVLALSILASVPSMAATADETAPLLECLRTKVTIADAKMISRQSFGGSVELTVTNGLSKALSGIFVELVVRSANRAVPWLTDTVSSAIAGGIEPGEMRVIRTYFVGLSDDVPADVVLDVTLLDLGDPDGNQLIRETRIIGDIWTDRKSDLGCN